MKVNDKNFIKRLQKGKEDAVADNNMFTYSFVVKNNNNPIEDPELLADLTMFIKINDKDINMSGTSWCEVVDKNTIKYLRTVNLLWY